jgi:multidrug transporter EmrE-like cation transporter
VTAQVVLVAVLVVAATALLWSTDHFRRRWASVACVALYSLTALLSSTALTEVPAAVTGGLWSAAAATSVMGLVAATGRRSRGEGRPARRA